MSAGWFCQDCTALGTCNRYQSTFGTADFQCVLGHASLRLNFQTGAEEIEQAHVDNLQSQLRSGIYCMSQNGV